MTAGIVIKRMIDIGANLTDPMFRGIYNSKQRHRDDYDDMLNRAITNGVEKIIITGGSLTDSLGARDLAQKNVNLFSTVGCHPTRCDEFEQYKQGPDGYLNELSDVIQYGRPKVVAIGELGLDYNRLQFCTKEIQQKYFVKQLGLAQSHRLPLFLHNRDSIDDFVEILTKNRDKFSSSGGVVHSFDGNHNDLIRLLDLGLHIGINGCSLKTEENLEVAKRIPIDRLLIETDCPWCEIRRTHAGYKYVRSALNRSKDAADPNFASKNRNEPLNLIQVLEVLAAIREENIHGLAEQIYENTDKLFFSSL